MKVRAAHELCSSRVLELFDFDNDNDGDAGDNGHYEVRYTAIGDRADMAPGSFGVYGQAKITGPIDFPLAFEFCAPEARDGFVAMIREYLHPPQRGVQIVRSPPSCNNKGN